MLALLNRDDFSYSCNLPYLADPRPDHLAALILKQVSQNNITLNAEGFHLYCMLKTHAAYGGKNPNKSLYPTIFETNLFRVGQCVTDVNGVAFCGEERKGSYLVIIKALTSTGAVFYDGKPTTPIDFDAGGVAAKSFQVP